ncbi:MAG: enoyl-CoA hydratase/isomerase family protein [Bacteroidetes bacterium]|nr:enoyl-CoA hydratase/isomerase family protein [Bacteroidota bacterium]
MNFSTILYEQEGGIITVTLNRPKVNALNSHLLADLSEACDAIRQDQSARVVILRSALDQFCAGADLKERQGMSEAEVKHFVKNVIGGVIRKIGDLEIPTIAAVHGSALGGGCELALACDFRILADDVKIGLRETALGIIPGAGGTQRLPRLIGYSNALLWILTARIFTASEALAQGVANLVVPRAILPDEAISLARELESNAPVAVRKAKKAVRLGLAVSLEKGLEIENECYNEIIPTNDRLEALKAFSEKRKPHWTNS